MGEWLMLLPFVVDVETTRNVILNIRQMLLPIFLADVIAMLHD